MNIFGIEMKIPSAPIRRGILVLRTMRSRSSGQQVVVFRPPFASLHSTLYPKLLFRQELVHSAVSLVEKQAASDAQLSPVTFPVLSPYFCRDQPSHFSTELRVSFLELLVDGPGAIGRFRTQPTIQKVEDEVTGDSKLRSVADKDLARQEFVGVDDPPPPSQDLS